MNTAQPFSRLQSPSKPPFNTGASYSPTYSTQTNALEKDCVLEIFLSPFHQGSLPNSFWHLCQPTSSDARWVTWLYPSCQIQSRILKSRIDMTESSQSLKQIISPVRDTIDSFRMVHLQEVNTQASGSSSKTSRNNPSCSVHSGHHSKALVSQHPVYSALLQAITLATSRLVIIETHHLKNRLPSQEGGQSSYLSLKEYSELNNACHKSRCQLVILHSPSH